MPRVRLSRVRDRRARQPEDSGAGQLRLQFTNVAAFRRRLLQWQRRVGPRRFPWRRRPVPYRVLVAEVMIQRTSAANVVHAYQQLVARAPTALALSRLSARDV